MGGDRSKQTRVRTPRIDHTRLVSPNTGGCADSPVVSASSGSSEEGPQQTPDHGPNQGNRCLLSVQSNTPVSRTSTPEDRQTKE